MKQVSFEDVSHWTHTKKTRKQQFLTQVNAILSWEDMLALIKPFYYKGEKGRTPIPLHTMLCIYFLQQWYGYSDSVMEDALYDYMAVRILGAWMPTAYRMRQPIASLAVCWKSTRGCSCCLRLAGIC